MSIAAGQSSQNYFAVQLDIWKFNTTAKELWGNNVGIADNMPFENGSQIQVLPAPETFLEATTDPSDTDHPPVSNGVFYVFGQCFAAAFVHVSLGCGWPKNEKCTNAKESTKGRSSGITSSDASLS